MSLKTDQWQLRRPGGRRIYVGLSRAQVEGALRSGKLRGDDLALPPGATAWMSVSAALSLPVVSAEPAAVQPLPGDWVPMRQEGRMVLPARDEEDPAEFDMTPMIDVTTLLLVFFLVAGMFQLEATLALPPAKTGMPQVYGDEKPVSVLIRAGSPEKPEPVMSFEDAAEKPVTLDDLVHGYQQRTEQGYLGEVVVKAHRSVPFGFVREAMAKLTEAGATNVLVGIEEAR